MRILLTGATGFLGSHLLPHLTVDCEVWTAGMRPAADPAARFVAVDLGRAGFTAALPDRVDAVVHLAQSHRYRDFPDGAGDMVAVNVAATAELLDYARRAGARHFLFASSGAVYQPFEGGMAETDPCAPTDFYGASKLAAEALIRAYASCFPVCILRLFFLYGRGQVARLAPTLVARLRAGAPITLAGSGQGLAFTPTHVADAAAVIVEALGRKWDCIVNVASPEIVTIHRMATMLGKRMGIEPTFVMTPGPEPAPITPNLIRLGERFPLEMFRPFSEGVADIVD